MHDATLKQIVRVAPGTIEELSEITGMGVRKVANYGADAAAYRRTTQRPVKALSGGMSARLLCGTVTARDRFDDQGPKDDATACQRAGCSPAPIHAHSGPSTTSSNPNSPIEHGRVAQPFGFRPHRSVRAAFPHTALPESNPSQPRARFRWKRMCGVGSGNSARIWLKPAQVRRR